MRLTQTGTGPGKIIGRGRVAFHSQRGRVIQSADVGWDGEPALIPFLPGLAFDEGLPNVRAILGEGPNTLYGPGATRYGMDAQKVVLAEFADWTLKAQQRLDRESVLPTFEVMTLAGLAPGEPVVDRLDYVVRINHKKARIWMETSYSSKQARAALYASMHQLLWDWVASHEGSRDVAVMLTVLPRQFEYYRVHGIPSDFMLRQIGRAPFVAWWESQHTVAGSEP
jgi:hypothetical protein